MSNPGQIGADAVVATIPSSADNVRSTEAAAAVAQTPANSTPEIATSNQKPEFVKSSSTKPGPTSSTTSTTLKSDETIICERPKKKAKSEQRFLEIKWYEFIDVNEINHSIFADEIPNAKFADSVVFDREQGENHEYRVYFCLVDSKSDDRKVLVEITVYYWYLPINLMHFHILSQDLADFSRRLWVAAGRNEDIYDDMSIEFGYSKIGKIEVKKLVGEAVGIKRKSDVMYVKSVEVHPGSEVRDSLTLIDMIFKKCKQAIFISYGVDLTKLGVKQNAESIGFTKMSNCDCFIGPNKKF